MKMDFDRSFSKTMRSEGGYSNRKNDVGGETIWGISRVYHPDWGGWMIVDALKQKPGKFPPDKFPDGLFVLVKAFYKHMFWDRILGDLLTDQRLADEMFDTAVNMGVHRAALFLQQALNALNRNQALYPDLVEDGLMGGKTLEALKALPFRDYDVLLKILNVLQGAHYIEFMRKSPVQEENARGWFARVEIGKS